ncbi:hypothetical protein KJ810_02590 [Patescibacteria group bacterium]|nr:hypothetical protein [Patescibacteria group bacterium]MBU2236249.1 hypothetical protein [Patescibacteria group bacterium]
MNSAKSPLKEFWVTITIGCRGEQVLFTVIDGKCYFTTMNTYGRWDENTPPESTHMADEIISSIGYQEHVEVDQFEYFDLQTHISRPDLYKPGEFSLQQIEFIVHRRDNFSAIDRVVHTPVECPPEVVRIFAEQIGKNPRQVEPRSQERHRLAPK